MFKLIDKIVGLRVSPEEEMEGLDLTEHGGTAYPDFALSSHGGVSVPTGRQDDLKRPVAASMPVRQE
jgi:Amt family ammonium transporter